MQVLVKSIWNLYSPVTTVIIRSSNSDSLYRPIHCAAGALAFKNISVKIHMTMEFLKKIKYKCIYKTNGWRNCTD